MSKRIYFCRALLFSSLCMWISGCTEATFASRNKMLLHNSSVQPKVVFLADNQRTLATSEPIFEQSAFVRQASKTAHRRPGMENFSLDVVRHIIDKKGGETKLILHAGDILNNSCRQEFNDVMEILQSDPKRPAYVVPGNHEGYYLGITSPLAIESRGAFLGILNELGGWAQSCTMAQDKEKNLCSAMKCSDKLNQDHECCLGSADTEEYLRFENPRYLAGQGPSQKKPYISNVLDKYSYVLAYTKKLGLHDYCINSEKNVENCPISVKISNNSLNVRCARPRTNSHEFLEEICWTELDDGDGPEGYDWEEKTGNKAFAERNDYKCKKVLNENGRIGYKKCRYREQEPWRHFVVQHVASPFGPSGQLVHFLLLDTASYQSGEVFSSEGGLQSLGGFGAANNARIKPAQRKIIERWMREIRDDSMRAQIVLIGHHPIKDFDHASEQFLATLAEYPNVTHYISGDNHDGYDIRHANLSNLREINLGATIDAPIEYALGGPSTDRSGAFDLARFFMTPAKNTKDGHYKLDRYYAESDGTFERCIDKGYAFEGTAPAFAPSALENTTSAFGKRLVTPAYYAGLPYIGSWLSFGATHQNVRNSSLFAYKINRLIDAIEVYTRVYDEAQIPWPAEISSFAMKIFNIEKKDTNKIKTLNANPRAIVQSVEDSVSFIGSKSFPNIRAFGAPKNFIRLHRNLAETLESFEKGLAPSLGNEDVHWAKLCRALFAAHRDRYGPKAPS